MNLVITPLYALIAVGLVVCFFGYRIFRLLLVLVGIYAGFLIGASLVVGSTSLSVISASTNSAALLVEVIGVIIGGVIGYVVYPVARFVAGLALGIVIAAVLISVFNSVDTLSLVLIIVGLIIGVVAAFALSDLIVMLATAVGGAWLAVTSYLQATGVDMVNGQAAFSANPAALIILIVLAALGFLAQRRANINAAS